MSVTCCTSRPVGANSASTVEIRVVKHWP
uniref:Uncharacterized protein n=1 Tax=Anguilla anguilla TaxID=7936 RepID=A0A0E9QCN8_ANGAN